MSTSFAGTYFARNVALVEPSIQKSQIATKSGIVFDVNATSIVNFSKPDTDFGTIEEVKIKSIYIETVNKDVFGSYRLRDDDNNCGNWCIDLVLNYTPQGGSAKAYEGVVKLAVPTSPDTEKVASVHPTDYFGAKYVPLKDLIQPTSLVFQPVAGEAFKTTISIVDFSSSTANILVDIVEEIHSKLIILGEYSASGSSEAYTGAVKFYSYDSSVEKPDFSFEFTSDGSHIQQVFSISIGSIEAAFTVDSNTNKATITVITFKDCDIVAGIGYSEGTEPIKIHYEHKDVVITAADGSAIQLDAVHVHNGYILYNGGNSDITISNDDTHAPIDTFKGLQLHIKAGARLTFVAASTTNTYNGNFRVITSVEWVNSEQLIVLFATALNFNEQYVFKDSQGNNVVAITAGHALPEAAIPKSDEFLVNISADGSFLIPDSNGELKEVLVSDLLNRIEDVNQYIDENVPENLAYRLHALEVAAEYECSNTLKNAAADTYEKELFDIKEQYKNLLI